MNMNKAFFKPYKNARKKEIIEEAQELKKMLLL